VKGDWPRILVLHGTVLVLLFLAQFVGGDYVQLSLTRIMLLAIYAMGYNLLYGYTGLLSLGHAMFFATGLYVAAIGTTEAGLSVPTLFALAIFIGAVVALVVGGLRFAPPVSPS